MLRTGFWYVMKMRFYVVVRNTFLKLLYFVPPMFPNLASVKMKQGSLEVCPPVAWCDRLSIDGITGIIPVLLILNLEFLPESFSKYCIFLNRTIGVGGLWEKKLTHSRFRSWKTTGTTGLAWYLAWIRVHRQGAWLALSRDSRYVDFELIVTNTAH